MRILALLLLALAAPAMAQPVPAPPAGEMLVPGGRAGWVTDGQGGCWVWAAGIEAGATGLTATWSAGCPRGPAEGSGRSVVRWQVAGQQLEMVWNGPLVAGKAEGRGTLVVTENGQLRSREEGEYRDDRLAQGRLEVPRHGIVYEGGWRFNHPHGQGTLRAEGQVISGVWEHGCLRRKGRLYSFTRAVESCEGQDT
jgi:hypothetical protein